MVLEGPWGRPGRDPGPAIGVEVDLDMCFTVFSQHRLRGTHCVSSQTIGDLWRPPKGVRVSASEEGNLAESMYIVYGLGCPEVLRLRMM